MGDGKRKKSQSDSSKQIQNGESENSEDEHAHENTWNCEKCNDSFQNDSDKMVVCSLCPSRFCLQCVKMSPKEYKALQTLERDDVFWMCSDCIIKMRVSIASNVNRTELSDMKTNITSKIETLEEKVNKLTEQIAKNTETNKTDNITKSFAEVLIGSKNTDESVHSKVQEIGVTGYLKNGVAEQRHIQNREQQQKMSETRILLYTKRKKLKASGKWRAYKRMPNS